MNYSNQKKGMILALTGIIFITPDSLFIRLANINSWNLIFYRGFIPFLVVFIGLIFIYKKKLFKELINNSWHGVAYAAVFTMTNIVFVISIENTNVANTLIMIALAPMLSAIISFIFLNENPDQKTWVAIAITTLAATAGAALPLMLDRMGFDPALMSAPFITTATDVAGVLIYLRTASWLLEHMHGLAS